MYDTAPSRKAQWPQRQVLDVYHLRVEVVTPFILAGGKSSRMQQDKAFMRLGRQTLLERALDAARAVPGALDPWIVGKAAKFAPFGRVIEDAYTDCGPLAGIHAALRQTETELSLMMAVDMPFLQPAFLSYLVSQSYRTGVVVVAPKAGGILQPLCAVYRRGFAAVAERALRAGKNKIDPLFTEVPIYIIEPEDLAQNRFPEEMFRNLNTPRDWEEAGALDAAMRRPKEHA